LQNLLPREVRSVLTMAGIVTFGSLQIGKLKVRVGQHSARKGQEKVAKGKIRP
jgi:hypothetical protein